MNLNRAAAFAALHPAALAGHRLGDYVTQTDRQARRKAAPGYNVEDDTPYWETWIANQKHCLAYHAALATVVGATAASLGIRISPRRAAAALAVSWLTHGFIDRRWPVIKLLKTFGSASWYEADPKTAVAEVDQTLHLAALHLALLILAPSR